MHLAVELVKLADKLDDLGHVEAVKLVDELLAKYAEAKKKNEEDWSPVLRMKCTKKEDGAYTVVIEAPSGIEPNDPLVLEYMRKYGPYPDIDVDYERFDADSNPSTPNKFFYSIRQRPGQAPDIEMGAPVKSPASSIFASHPDVVQALMKIANELDEANETELADKIDSLLNS